MDKKQCDGYVQLKLDLARLLTSVEVKMFMVAAKFTPGEMERMNDFFDVWQKLETDAKICDGHYDYLKDIFQQIGHLTARKLVEQAESCYTATACVQETCVSTERIQRMKHTLGLLAREIPLLYSGRALQFYFFVAILCLSYYKSTPSFRQSDTLTLLIGYTLELCMYFPVLILIYYNNVRRSSSDGGEREQEEGAPGERLLSQSMRHTLIWLTSDEVKKFIIFMVASIRFWQVCINKPSYEEASALHTILYSSYVLGFMGGTAYFIKLNIIPYERKMGLLAKKISILYSDRAYKLYIFFCILCYSYYHNTPSFQQSDTLKLLINYTSDLTHWIILFLFSYNNLRRSSSDDVDREQEEGAPGERMLPQWMRHTLTWLTTYKVQKFITFMVAIIKFWHVCINMPSYEEVSALHTLLINRIYVLCFVGGIAYFIKVNYPTHVDEEE